MTRPTSKEVDRAIRIATSYSHSQAHSEAISAVVAALKVAEVGRREAMETVVATLKAASEILSLFPEGRSEQDQGGERVKEAVERLTALCAPDSFVPSKEYGTAYDARQLERLRSFIKFTPTLLSDLSAARLRIKALEEGLQEANAFANAVGGATLGLAMSGANNPNLDDALMALSTRGLEQAKRTCALLSSAQGETKEGFDGLPELPCTDAGPSPRSPDPWQTMNRTRLIEVAREWAANALARHDNNTHLAQSLRDADFYRADALNEFAALIEAGEFDSVRPSAPDAAALVEGE